MNLVELLLPPRCPFCGKIMVHTEPCESCLKTATELTASVCKRCGAYPEDCNCFGRNYAFKRNVSAFVYEHGPRQLVLRFKMQKKPQLAAFMARRMYYHILARLGTDFSCVVYVPQSAYRWFKRGFCPTELLAQNLADRFNVPCVQALKRVGSREQKELSFVERWANAQKNYALLKNAAVGGRVLLVDDLFTTGATLNACAALLRKAGADEVVCATFAIDVKKS